MWSCQFVFEGSTHMIQIQDRTKAHASLFGRACVLLVLALAVALLMPIQAFAEGAGEVLSEPLSMSYEVDPEGKNGTEEAIQINKWKTGTFTTSSSTTSWWYPDVYKFTVSKAGTYSLMLETQKASYHNTGLVLLLCDYYSKSGTSVESNPIGWISVQGYPIGYCLEVDLAPGTYWLTVGDAYDIYRGIGGSISGYNMETFSSDIYNYLNGYNFEGNFVGSYRVGIFSRPDGSVPVYRMYNKRTSEHLYTKSRNEYNSCGIGNYADWRQEGIAWFAPKSSSTPVYRLYNRGLLVHHYTSSKAERDMLVRKYGWKAEGVAFYSDDAHGKPLYRVYNGKIKPPQHHYTSSKGERDTLVSSQGWRNEGVGFYGMK